MSLSALDAIDDALTATGRYRPQGLREWVWTVLVAGTVASPGFGVPTGGNSSGEMPADSRAAIEEFLPAALPDVLLLAGVAAVALWLLLVAVGSFLEFPFLRWLNSGQRSLRAEIRANRNRALGLAGFRLLLNLLSLSVLVGATVSLAGPEAGPLTYLIVLGEYWVLFALLGLATGLVSAFTTAFVVPAMWIRDLGVVAGWRRVWPTLTDAPKEFLVYAVAVAIFGTVGGMLVGLAALVGLAPALAVGLAVAAVAGGTAGIAAGAVLGGVGMTVAAGLVYAFVQVFLRFYGLFILGDVDPALDAIPERRRAVRSTSDDGDDSVSLAASSGRKGGGDGGDATESDGDDGDGQGGNDGDTDGEDDDGGGGIMHAP